MLFISDLHLHEAIPHTVAAFEYFIRVTANTADSVFILGDLFEYWIGDDMLVADPFAARMASLMRTLSERGIALYIMHGNRDFLLGKRFMQAAGAVWLPDPFVISVFGSRIVLSHGDALCTDDYKYQLFRRFSRSPAMQFLFLAWPLKWRCALARRLRGTRHDNRARPMSSYDVTSQGVQKLFASSNTMSMIHGHTHKPACHQEHGGTRWVLPDWDLDCAAPRGGYLQIDAQGIQAFPLEHP
jgi:UDP-2,3-diacylglucosamine hydrolase